MSRQKTKKFEENSNRRHVVEPGKDYYNKMKGQWKTFFGNDNDIVLEVACGRGEYSVGLAPHFPDKNFIGIDIKGDRLWHGARVADEQGLSNVAFLRTKVHDLLDFFEEDEVSEIWIVNPDPRPKNRDARRRLTHPRFLRMYEKILKADGLMRFKTDNTDLFNYTKEVLELRNIPLLSETMDLYESPLYAEHYGVSTRYERMFVAEGHTIKYLTFKFPIKDFKIRKGKKEDLPRTLELIKELAAFEKAPEKVTNTLEAMERDGFGDKQVFEFFVAEKNDTIVGIALFYTMYSTWRGRGIYLDDLIVTASERGNGIGTALLQTVTEHAEDTGAKVCMWQVLDWNKPAINLYEKMGAEIDPEWMNCKLFYGSAAAKKA